MRNLFNIVILAIISSSSLSAKVPKWISSAQNACPQGYLCAVGEGESVMISDLQARNSLAKIFSIEIHSTFSLEEDSSNGFLSNEIRDKIKERTSFILEGSKIERRFESDTQFYSLAKIDKKILKKTFQNEMDNLEARVRELSNSKELWDIVKAELLISQWDKAYNRFLIVSNEKKVLDEKLREKVSRSKKKLTHNTSIFVEFREDQPKVFKPLLEETLLNLGYQIDKKASKATHHIKGEFVSEKEYLNVDGFVKYRFRVKLYTLDQEERKKGVVESDVVSIGRTQRQAYDKSIDELKRKVIQSFREVKLK